MRLGRYELFHRLAKGGMGEVFLARRKGPGEIEKRVVIKRIRPELSGDPRFVEMFLREARVSMGLSHRNIAAVFDFGRAGRELFLAMEHVHGRDLGRALLGQGELAVAMALNYYILFRDDALADVVFTAALMSVLLNELWSTRLLKGLLIDSGDIRHEIADAPIAEGA